MMPLKGRQRLLRSGRQTGKVNKFNFSSGGYSPVG
jgi:hypothetical protein